MRSPWVLPEGVRIVITMRSIRSGSPSGQDRPRGRIALGAGSPSGQDRPRGRIALGAAIRVLAANVGLTMALLGGVEAGVRLAHPEIGPVGSDRRLIQPGAYGATDGLRAGASGRSGGALFRVDARRHWKYAAHAPGRAPLPGWLFLGDSVTMGPSVPPDSTFAGRLAAAQDSLGVWNTALIGYATDDYQRVLAAHLKAGGVRRVTLVWCLNDVYAGVPVGAAPAGPRLLEGPLMRVVRTHVYTYQWLKAVLTDRPRAYFAFDRRFYTPGDPHLAQALRHLRTMAAWCRARRIPFEVVLVPYEYGLRTGDAGPHTLLRASLEASRIAVCDVTSALRTAGPPATLYLYGDGIHLSAKGHRVVAEALAACVRGAKRLTPASPRRPTS